ncbi:uncharacterized protein LOC120328946 [Styela clava]
MKMRALWWEGTTKTLSYIKDAVEPSVVEADDVKLKIAFSGVCGSDFHFMSGEMGKFAPKSDGVILGHEYSGTVVDIGSAVQDLKVGDTVAVHKLPEGVSLEGGALAEPYSCVLRGWNLMHQKPIKTAKVLIQGAGIIGSMFACLFHVNGYKDVTICEPHEVRRNICSGLRLGYEITHPDELDKMMSSKDEDTHGFDVIFDCTGNCRAVQKLDVGTIRDKLFIIFICLYLKTINLARRGAFISMFGCCPAKEKIEIEPFQIYWKELKIAGSFINPFCFEEAVAFLKDLKEYKLLDLQKFGVKTFDLSEYKAAFTTLKSGEVSKVIFRL